MYSANPDRKLAVARNAIIGPNPIGTAQMTPAERLQELSSILAVGAIRLRLKQGAGPDGLDDGPLANFREGPNRAHGMARKPARFRTVQT